MLAAISHAIAVLSKPVLCGVLVRCLRFQQSLDIVPKHCIYSEIEGILRTILLTS